MAWTIHLSPEASRQLSKLPQGHQTIICQAIDRMMTDPFRGDVRPLKAERWRGRYRKRVGRYRLIFTPIHQEQKVEISAILLRAEHTYR